MAVSNPQAPNLAPAFGNIQDALSQRAKIASQETGSMGTINAATGAVSKLAQEQRAKDEARALALFKHNLAKDIANSSNAFKGRFDYKVTAKSARDFEKTVNAPVGSLSFIVGEEFKDRETAIEVMGNAVERTVTSMVEELKERDPKAKGVVTPGPVRDQVDPDVTNISVGTSAEFTTRLPGEGETSKTKQPTGEISTATTGTKLGVDQPTNEAKVARLQKTLTALGGSSDAKASDVELIALDIPGKGNTWAVYNKVKKTTTLLSGDPISKADLNEALRAYANFVGTDPQSKELISVSKSRGTVKRITGPKEPEAGEKIKTFAGLERRFQDVIDDREKKYRTDTKELRDQMNVASQIRSFVQTNPRAGVGPIQRQMARFFGEVRVTDKDAEAFSGSKDIFTRFLDLKAKWVEGRFSEVTANDLEFLVELSERAKRGRMAKLAIQATNSFISREPKADKIFVLKQIAGTNLEDIITMNFDTVDEVMDFNERGIIPDNTIFRYGNRIGIQEAD